MVVDAEEIFRNGPPHEDGNIRHEQRKQNLDGNVLRATHGLRVKDSRQPSAKTANRASDKDEHERQVDEHVAVGGQGRNNVNDLIAVHRPEPPLPRDPPPMGWRELAIRCAAYPLWLSDWEIAFLSEVLRRTQLSRKQLAVLDRIALKLHSRGAPP